MARQPDKIYLTEDPLFFGDERYPMAFHKQKLCLHRASMRQWKDCMEAQVTTQYFEYADGGAHLRKVFEAMVADGMKTVLLAEVVDFILEKRLRKYAGEFAVELEWLETPLFLNTKAENEEFRAGKKRWFMADFYKWQRLRLDVMIEEGDKPVGGQWSFDKDNRKKLPKKERNDIPATTPFPEDAYRTEAVAYVEKHFAENYGDCSSHLYPITSEEAQDWFEEFLSLRFEKFGPYEDAIVEGESILYHSVLTPALNIGLITPAVVLKRTLAFAEKHKTPQASLEGFVRQIIGWREFMRATYEDLGVTMRTTNAWEHTRPIPDSFYDASTGLLPIDDAIERVLATGYCHHIERLMVLGGFMFLNEIDPDAIYQWFMEMFIDSYDWVMVPNVYAMSQNADGGNITTKPYFSGSNYVIKMSHYKKGEPWCEVWDGLYWRWILKHAKDLGKNARWAMMVRMAEKMDKKKKTVHLKVAKDYLSKA